MTKAGITMSDFTYTRPRQSTCVMYNTSRLHHDLTSTSELNRSHRNEKTAK